MCPQGSGGPSRISPQRREQGIHDSPRWWLCGSSSESASQASRPSGHGGGKMLVVGRACVQKELEGQARELGFDAGALGVSGGTELCITDSPLQQWGKADHVSSRKASLFTRFLPLCLVISDHFRAHCFLFV